MSYGRVRRLGLVALVGACTAPVPHGESVVRVLPGARLDVLTPAGAVASSTEAGPDGRVVAEVTAGDLLVMVPDNFGEVVIVERAQPGREYALAGPALRVGRSMTVTFRAVPDAVEYAVSSRCGGTNFVTDPQAFMGACEEDEEVVLRAYGDGRRLLAAGVQRVPVITEGMLVRFTAPLAPPRAIAIAATVPADHDPRTLVTSATLITPGGVRVEGAEVRDGVALVPDLPGVVAVEAALYPADGSYLRLEHRAPIADALALDLTALPLPRIDGAADRDPDTGLVTWTTRTPEAIVADTTRLRFQSTEGRTYAVIAPYVGAAVGLPPVPPDLPPLVPVGPLSVEVAATPQGYNVTVNTLARRFDPAYGPYTLARATYFE